MVKDMTQGSAAKLILIFSLPMLLGNVFQQMYNMVDAIVVGRFVGPNALAAVGTSFPIIFLLISLVLGLTMGSGVVISQFFGAKKIDKVRRAVSTALSFQLVFALAMSLIGLFLSRPLLHLLRTPPEIIGDSVAYMQIFFGGLIFMFAYNAFAGILRSLGDSKTPLYFLMISSVINIGLDIYFVVALGWGVRGVAWATLIAQGISSVLCIVFVYKRVPLLRFTRAEWVFDIDIFKTMLKIGIPSSIQQTVASVGMMAMQALVNSFGSVTVAAYTAASRMDSFALMPIMSLGMAVSTFTGQNIGANRLDRVRSGLWASIGMVVFSCAVVSIFVFTMGSHMIQVFINAEETEVIARGVQYMQTVSIFYVIFGIMNVFSGVLRGAGDAMIPMVTTIVALITRVSVGYWLVTIPSISYRGIWWAIPAGWVVGTIIPTLRYFSGAWKAKAVVRQQMFAEASPAPSVSD
ncbi:MAG: MATE family efflux transporter [Peptococcaceae bacterium]|nr:MATE family efflux transporter [Peptococcaceae bacterium]